MLIYSVVLNSRFTTSKLIILNVNSFSFYGIKKLLTCILARENWKPVTKARYKMSSQYQYGTHLKKANAALADRVT
jgi:hypothetical protein